jgi:nicotinate-nucleotide--dimethylbenzimidazole phosphoribosyltransferase
LSFPPDRFPIPAPVNPALEKELTDNLERLQKPNTTLGFFADIWIRLGLQQQRAVPAMPRGSLLLFAGDNALATEQAPPPSGLSTPAQIMDILHGQAAFQQYPAENALPYRLVDVGVDFSFESNLSYWLHHGNRFINARLANGVAHPLQYPAMPTAHSQAAVDLGSKMAQREHHHGHNLLALSSLAWGAPLVAFVLHCAATDARPEALARGTRTLLGLPEEEGAALTRRVLRSHPKTTDGLTLLSLYGSYEMAALVGALLEGASRRMTLLIDGYAAAVALLLARAWQPEVVAYALWAHTPWQGAHRALYEELGAPPCLHPGAAEYAAGEGSMLAWSALQGKMATLGKPEPGEGPY